MALWKAGGGSLNKESDFGSWHCGRQANYVLDHAFDERTLSGFEAFEGT